MAQPISRTRVWLARFIALGADTLQLMLLPLFVGGAAEGFDAALDILVALLMIALLGFHPALLPAAVAEALPMVNIVPTWTLAVFYATRKSSTPALPSNAARGAR